MALFRCEDFSSDLDDLVLLRRLKDLGKYMSGVPVDITTSSLEWEYNDLVLHLASPFFLTHASVGIKLHTAFNLAQVLRIRQDKHPYSDVQLNHIILFLISQLQRVTHERIALHHCQKIILGVLVSQDVIPVICNLNELEPLIVDVFSSLLKVVHPGMSYTTMDGMIKLIGTMVEHSPNVPEKMIQMILLNCQKRVKASNKLVYSITVDFIRKYCNVLRPAFEKVIFEDLLVHYPRYTAVEGETVLTYEKFKGCLVWLWKLHSICSELTLPILRNLEPALYNMTHGCRSILIKFLGKLFSSPSNIELNQDCPSLWNAFLGRFQDKKLEIRLDCLDQVPDLFKMEVLRADLVSTIEKRKMDRVSKVRDKLALLVKTLLMDSDLYTEEIVSNLSAILEELTLDDEFKVRCSGSRSMAELYNHFAGKGREYLPFMTQMEKYPACILQNYWTYGKQDKRERLAVIQLMNRYILPYSMPPDQRMRRLFKVLSDLDYTSCTRLSVIKYRQHICCKHLLDIIKDMKERREGAVITESKKTTLMKISALSLHLPMPLKAGTLSIEALVRKLSEDGPEVDAVIRVLTHESQEDIDQILESFQDIRKCANEFMWIFELSSDWLFDKVSFKIFLSYVDESLSGETDLIDELNLEEFPLENVFKMLEVLSASCLSRIHDREIMRIFINWLRLSGSRTLKITVLKILTHLQSEDKELLSKYPDIMNELILMCQDSCFKSDTELSKWCIKSLLISETKREELCDYFQSVVKELVECITSSEQLRAYCAIYCLGYISLYLGSYFKDVLSDALSDEVFCKIMMTNGSDVASSPLTHECISLQMKIKARYLKFLAQFAFEGGVDYKDVLATLFKVIEKENTSNSQRNEEASWMRLSVGCAILLILNGGTMDMLTCQEFYLLSDLMTDEVLQVREAFFKKLLRQLHCDYPKITLPPELLSLLILGDVEELEHGGSTEKETLNYIRYLFSKKINFINIHMNIKPFPEFDNKNEVLVYGLLALSHSKQFMRINDSEQLKKVKEKLAMLLDFLLGHEDVDLNFYLKQVEMVKSHKLKGENEKLNKKLWVLCDIAVFKMKKYDVKRAKSMNPTLPMHFFEPKPIKNTRNYLSKHVIANLFLEETQTDPQAKKADEEEESSEDESDVTDNDPSSLVVMIGEGNISAEWDVEDGINEESGFGPESHSASTNSRKRKISDV
ncbi:sister chromatid cohesion protein PDS5 homolog B-A-like isoform X2 [Ischnura elegans]|nr:sister chromatid cohesion protein PDS5 homolog B-A-like isoform X2 [Ischnura elegans]XP_046396820.1 sister chromatid cohesion protein PDS5 homolog B-A-like isoform X2 [Ischnura elegans]